MFICVCVYAYETTYFYIYAIYAKTPWLYVDSRQNVPGFRFHSLRLKASNPKYSLLQAFIHKMNIRAQQIILE